jgi:serine/threonine protein kinase
MNSPVRVVCEGCLRSLEIGPDSGPGEENACPHCGFRIDGGMSETRSSEAVTRVPGQPDDSETTDGPQPIDWAAAWTRGTLGSLGRFQLRERLGDGGFGEVFLAYDPRLDRDVAVKVLKQPNPTDRVMERFFREARAVARLDHPNIVAVHDAGFEDGRCWVAYQLVSGRPLWWYRDRQRMDPVTAARIIRDLADALSHAHSMGVVHRDLKPGNVIIDDRGRPRLIDFGLARRSDVDSDLTRDGVIVGTPAYMSPEQAGGMSRQADERSDVYSLGVIFYELLCGRRPQEYRAEPGRETGKPAEKKGPSARSVDPNVPPVLDAIGIKAMSPRPADRYPSARALAEAIDHWLSRRRKTRRRAMTGALALLFLVGIAVSAVSLPRLASQKINAESPSNEDRQPTVSDVNTPTSSARTPEVTGRKTLAQEPSNPGSGGQVVVGKGKKYHNPTCPHVYQIEPLNRRTFPSRREAETLKYGPCEHYKPDESPVRTVR